MMMNESSEEFDRSSSEEEEGVILGADELIAKSEYKVWKLNNPEDGRSFKSYLRRIYYGIGTSGASSVVAASSTAYNSSSDSDVAMEEESHFSSPRSTQTSIANGPSSHSSLYESGPRPDEGGVVGGNNYASIQTHGMREGLEFSWLMEDHVHWTIEILIAIVSVNNTRKNAAVENLVFNKMWWRRVMEDKAIVMDLVDGWYKPGPENDGLGSGIFLEHTLQVKTVFENVLPFLGTDGDLVLNEAARDAVRFLYGENLGQVAALWSTAVGVDRENFGDLWKGHLDCTVDYATKLIGAAGDENDPMFLQATKDCKDKGGALGWVLDDRTWGWGWPWTWWGGSDGYDGYNEKYFSSPSPQIRNLADFLQSNAEKTETFGKLLRLKSSSPTMEGEASTTIYDDIITSLIEQGEGNHVLLIPTQEAWNDFYKKLPTHEKYGKGSFLASTEPIRRKLGELLRYHVVSVPTTEDDCCELTDDMRHHHKGKTYETLLPESNVVFETITPSSRKEGGGHRMSKDGEEDPYSSSSDEKTESFFNCVNKNAKIVTSGAIKISGEQHPILSIHVIDRVLVPDARIFHKDCISYNQTKIKRRHFDEIANTDSYSSSPSPPPPSIGNNPREPISSSSLPHDGKNYEDHPEQKLPKLIRSKRNDPIPIIRSKRNDHDPVSIPIIRSKRTTAVIPHILERHGTPHSTLLQKTTHENGTSAGTEGPFILERSDRGLHTHPHTSPPSKKIPVLERKKPSAIPSHMVGRTETGVPILERNHSSNPPPHPHPHPQTTQKDIGVRKKKISMVIPPRAGSAAATTRNNSSANHVQRSLANLSLNDENVDPVAYFKKYAKDDADYEEAISTKEGRDDLKTEIGQIEKLVQEGVQRSHMADSGTVFSAFDRKHISEIMGTPEESNFLTCCQKFSSQSPPPPISNGVGTTLISAKVTYMKGLTDSIVSYVNWVQSTNEDKTYPDLQYEVRMVSFSDSMTRIIQELRKNKKELDDRVKTLTIFALVFLRRILEATRKSHKLYYAIEWVASGLLEKFGYEGGSEAAYEPKPRIPMMNLTLSGAASETTTVSSRYESSRRSVVANRGISVVQGGITSRKGPYGDMERNLLKYSQSIANLTEDEDKERTTLSTAGQYAKDVMTNFGLTESGEVDTARGKSLTGDLRDENVQKIFVLGEMCSTMIIRLDMEADRANLYPTRQELEEFIDPFLEKQLSPAYPGYYHQGE